jgi:hypothetical protein
MTWNTRLIIFVSATALALAFGFFGFFFDFPERYFDSGDWERLA